MLMLLLRITYNACLLHNYIFCEIIITFPNGMYTMVYTYKNPTKTKL